MPRPKKVKLIKGEKRVVSIAGEIRIEQTTFCGECKRRTKGAATQRPHRVIARVCDRENLHKDGKVHFWPLKKVVIITS